jgi:hypothetical protein
LLARKFAREYFSVIDTYRCLEFSILGMDMREVMLPVVKEIHPNNDTIKHGDYRHFPFPRFHFQPESSYVANLLGRTLP